MSDEQSPRTASCCDLGNRGLPISTPTLLEWHFPMPPPGPSPTNTGVAHFRWQGPRPGGSAPQPAAARWGRGRQLPDSHGALCARRGEPRIQQRGALTGAVVMNCVHMAEAGSINPERFLLTVL